VGVAVSIPIDRIRRLTPFFFSRSIIATKSATERATVGHGEIHDRISAPKETADLFLALFIWPLTDIPQRTRPIARGISWKEEFLQRQILARATSNFTLLNAKSS
jgi:hypothetical protein